MVAVPLCGPQRYVVVGSPALVAAHGLPSHPRDLLRTPCVRLRYPSGRVPAWEIGRAHV